MIKQYDYLFKIVIIGTSSVGKSSILRRFSDDSFQESYLATIGVDFRFKSIKVGESVVKLQIWDTAGQERFRTITSAYYKGAHGIFMTYDMTMQQTFQDIKDFWYGEVQKYSENSACVYLLGNKADCEGKFDQAEVEAFCSEKSIKLYYVSAKTGSNVGAAFSDMSEKLTTIYPKIEKKQQTNNAVVSNIMKKKKQFQLKSATAVSTGPAKKKCC